MAKKFALLIGVSRFEDKRIHALNAPESDVTHLAETLRNPQIGEFDSVELSINEPYDAIRRKIVSLVNNRETDDLIMLYYSGHGVLAFDSLYFTARNSDLDHIAAAGFRSREIKEFLDSCRCKRQVLILDCCHAGDFAGDGYKSAARDSLVTEQTFGGFGRVVMMASSALQTAPDGPAGPNSISPFTHFLLEGLRDGAASPDDEFISAQAVADYAERRMRASDPKARPRVQKDEQNGPIIIARNGAAGILRIPEDLRTGLSDNDPLRRLGAISRLKLLVGSGDSATRRAIHRLLESRQSVERDADVRDAIRLFPAALNHDVPLKKHQDPPNFTRKRTLIFIFTAFMGGVSLAILLYFLVDWSGLASTTPPNTPKKPQNLQTNIQGAPPSAEVPSAFNLEAEVNAARSARAEAEREILAARNVQAEAAQEIRDTQQARAEAAQQVAAAAKAQADAAQQIEEARQARAEATQQAEIARRARADAAIKIEAAERAQRDAERLADNARNDAAAAQQQRSQALLQAQSARQAEDRAAAEIAAARETTIEAQKRTEEANLALNRAGQSNLDNQLIRQGPRISLVRPRNALAEIQLLNLIATNPAYGSPALNGININREIVNINLTNIGYSRQLLKTELKAVGKISVWSDGYGIVVRLTCRAGMENCFISESATSAPLNVALFYLGPRAGTSETRRIFEGIFAYAASD